MSFPYFSNVLIPFPVTAMNSWVVTGQRAANARNVRSLKIRNAGRLRLLASVKRQVRSAASSRDSNPACGGFRFAPAITESLGLTDRVPRQGGTAEVAAHEQGASACKDAPYDLAGRFDPCNRATVNFYAIPPPLFAPVFPNTAGGRLLVRPANARSSTPPPVGIPRRCRRRIESAHILRTQILLSLAATQTKHAVSLRRATDRGESVYTSLARELNRNSCSP